MEIRFFLIPAILLSVLSFEAFGQDVEVQTGTSESHGPTTKKMQIWHPPRALTSLVPATPFLKGQEIEAPLPLVNTEQLLNALKDGHPPPEGIDPEYATREALEQIMGLKGIFGPNSPLGDKGPIGSTPINPYFWWAPMADRFWDIWLSIPIVHLFFDVGGPLSRFGPCSENGALSDELLKYSHAGIYSILGPRGPLGPLGPLGALGALGAVQSKHIRGPDENGVYYDANTGKPIGRIKVPFSRKETRDLGIVEIHPQGYADRLSDHWGLDMQNMILGKMKWDENTHVYRVKSTHNRPGIFTAMVVPDHGIMLNLERVQPANFDIIIQDEHDKEIMRSTQRSTINFIQIAVPGDCKLKISIKVQGQMYRPQPYRLVLLEIPKEFWPVFPDFRKERTVLHDKHCLFLLQSVANR